MRNSWHGFSYKVSLCVAICLIITYAYANENVTSNHDHHHHEDNDGGSRIGDSANSTSITYAWVMKKMDEYCQQPYSKADDAKIDQYSNCFANLLHADVAIVKMCRSKAYKTNRDLKTADCQKEEHSQDTHKIRDCISTEMSQSNSTFKFADDNLSTIDTDALTHQFFQCMEKVFN